ncbi:hypothetical protein K8R03_02745 [Candidatus Kaiserbacteria bacterium]|nr:hypothetical protein [Candidatus Kaiserbacteria bacterium]
MNGHSVFPLSWGPRPPVADESYDWVTNSFGPSDPRALDIVPVKCDEPWETLETFTRKCAPHLVLGLFPAFLQIDTRFHRAIHSLGLPVCTMVEEQAKIAAAVVGHLDIGGVVLLQSACTVFERELAKFKPAMTVRYLAILAPEERPGIAHGEIDILFELHLVPGIVGLFQCEQARDSARIFHPNDRFVWEFADSKAWVSDNDGRRFSHAEIPQPVFPHETQCACGRSTSLRLN